MLRGIRNASNTWLGRIVMGAVMTLLAGIFALWGINDIFRNFGRSSLAKIGRTEISSEQFRQIYNDRLQAVIRQTGKPISPEVANALGLPRQVLSEMVAQAGLDEEARKMRLGISDAEISKRITNDPMFQIGGRFNPAQFQDVLRNAGYTEQRYVAEQRNTTLRQQVIESVSGDVALPKSWLDAINQFQNQQRSIQYVALGPAQAGDIPAPTDEELSKYFDGRKILFRAPEYRKIVTVTATPEELAKTVEISDDDVKKVFDDNRNRFITPERRHIERMTFPNMTEAQAASDRIKAGTTFAALAAERGVKEQDLDLGTVPKSLILDPAMADAAFSLKEGEISAPVQTKDGSAVLVTVAKIIPEDAKSFADVAPQIRNDMALVRVKKTVADIHDKIEDARAGGATLEEAAQKLNLPVVTYDAVDESGRDPSGKPIDKLPHARDVVNAAFQTDVGVDNDPIDADGGYIWYDVANITPAHERKLDEVKDQVAAQWRDAEVASRLKAKAADILDKLKNGGTFESLAADNGIKVETANDITRSKPTPDISSPMVEAIFHTAKDAYASAAGDKPTQWIVFRVTDIKTPDLDANAPAMKQIEQGQSRQVGDDIFGQYMAWLEQDLGTSVNTTVLQQALGNSSAPPPDIN
jgi:peptidyl-prolyl cis-trans isomerase D